MAWALYRTGIDGNARTEQTVRAMEDLVEASFRKPWYGALVGSILRSSNDNSRQWNRPERDLQSVRALSRAVRDRVYYQPDPPGTEAVSVGEVTWGRGFGDCDDKSVLLASLLRAAGYAVRFRTQGGTENLVHVLVEVQVPGVGWIAVDPVQKTLAPPAARTIRRGEVMGLYDGILPYGIGSAPARRSGGVGELGKTEAQIKEIVRREFAEMYADKSREIASEIAHLKTQLVQADQSVRADLRGRIDTLGSKLQGIRDELTNLAKSERGALTGELRAELERRYNAVRADMERAFGVQINQIEGRLGRTEQAANAAKTVASQASTVANMAKVAASEQLSNIQKQQLLQNGYAMLQAQGSAVTGPDVMSILRPLIEGSDNVRVVQDAERAPTYEDAWANPEELFS